VGRMRAAHHQHEEKQALLNYIPKGENLEKIKNDPRIRPFSFVEKNKGPLLSVEVKISKSKMRKLVISDKKSLRHQIDEFCKKYQISKDKQFHLQKQIELTLY
jgi:hypothetical protein